MNFSSENWLIEADELANIMQNGEIALLDSTWYLPHFGKDARQEWERERIGDARFFDFNGRIRDISSPLPHTLPSPEVFVTEARRLGVNASDHVVVYDQIGLFSATRAWIMFYLMGHERISALNGGLPAWKAQKYSVNRKPPRNIPPGDFVAKPNFALLANKDHVLSAIESEDATVVDARPADRFSGETPEPRSNVRSGHIPKSLNLPFTDIQENGFLKSDEELRQIFQNLNPTHKKIIFSCGSGVTASLLLFAALKIGIEDIALYDGSWAEWGAENSGLPVEPRK